MDGTAQGHRAALILALTAALLHAVFGALQKGRHDPWLTRVAIDGWLVVLALPLIFLVPWPEPHMWLIFAGMVAIHFVYKVLQAMAYTRGAYTVVYPVVRGTGPLFAVLGAGLIFGETFTPVQWLGVGVLLSGIFGLGVYNYIFLTTERDTLRARAGSCGGHGLLRRALHDLRRLRHPRDGQPLHLPRLVLLSRRPGLSAARCSPRRCARGCRACRSRPLLLRGLAGALIAFGSFGSIMLATRLDKVGEAAVLRETSTVFAALIGWLVLKETVGPRRIALMSLIAIGAVVVEMGG